MSEPLAGLTVIEMTVAVQGPAAGLYLRDMGAEVIKIEPPLGDSSRAAAERPVAGVSRGLPFHHAAYSRGSGVRSVARVGYSAAGRKYRDDTLFVVVRNPTEFNLVARR